METQIESEKFFLERQDKFRVALLAIHYAGITSRMEALGMLRQIYLGAEHALIIGGENADADLRFHRMDSLAELAATVQLIYEDIIYVEGDENL